MNKNVLKSLKALLLTLPTPINITYWWNFGSLLGFLFLTQFLSGFFLSIHYCPNISLAYNSIIHINQNVNQGWLVHTIHVNGASMFFMSIYAHMSRGIYYHSFALMNTWLLGTMIYLLSMATAFLGYVLPWGQMSFWGATVITNLTTTIPYLGPPLLNWLWGGFSINNATLNRFFSLHFVLPFIMTPFILAHLYSLHQTGSKNPLGVSSNLNKIPFHCYFTIKDLFGFLILTAFFMTINFLYPTMFKDPDNFNPANPMTTPLHIQPEWYFLFAYAILRSIPNKLGGVLALLGAILILLTLIWSSSKMKSNAFYPLNQILFWLFINNFLLLTFMGTQTIEAPYINVSQMLTLTYFTFFFINTYTLKWWDTITFH